MKELLNVNDIEATSPIEMSPRSISVQKKAAVMPAEAGAATGAIDAAVPPV